MSIFDKISRLQGMRGGSVFEVVDTPGGRLFKTQGAGTVEEPAGGESRYDVVTIGGWWMDGSSKVTTVNDYFGEQNHVFDAGLTPAEIGSGSWTWGGTKDAVNMNFAIAAIPSGSKGKIPDYEGDSFWNPMLPNWMLAARSIGQNTTGEPITLTLEIGVIENA